MGWLNVVLLLYGLLNIAMGVHGYFKGSIASLLAAGTCGLIVLISIVLYRFKPRAARITSLVIAVLLLGWSTPKAMQNQLYPGGLTFVTSLAVTACLLVGHVMGMKARKKRESTQKE
jgi:uncharacterized membrane protein YfcA